MGRVFAKALLIYHFVEVSEAYRFFLHLCKKHILDCHGFCGLSWSLELCGGKSGPLSNGIWRRCLKTWVSKSFSVFFSQQSQLVYKPCIDGILKHAGHYNTILWNALHLCNENGKLLSHTAFLLLCTDFTYLFIYSYFYWMHQDHLFAYLLCWNPKLYCITSYSPNMVQIPLLFQLDNWGDGEQIVYFILEMALLNDILTSFNFHLLLHSTSFLWFFFPIFLINTHV